MKSDTSHSDGFTVFAYHSWSEINAIIAKYVYISYMFPFNTLCFAKYSNCLYKNKAQHKPTI